MNRRTIAISGVLVAMFIGSAATSRAVPASIVVTDLESRLEALDPADPRGYFELAEDLADGDSDQERRIARRLFGLAGRLDREKYAASAALGAQPPYPLFTAGELNVTLYRIPVLLAHRDYRLAFAEARLPCVRSCGKSTSWGDSSPKHIAFRRSTDGGASWSPTVFIVRSDGTNDNL